MSTRNICYCEEIKKIYVIFGCKKRAIWSYGIVMFLFFFQTPLKSLQKKMRMMMMD